LASSKNKVERDFRLISNQKSSLDFNKIRIGKDTLKNDVIANLDFWRKPNRKISREQVDRALESKNLKELRHYSNVFFDTSGIYSRLCRYMAYLYRYDWFVVPVVNDNKLKNEKIIEGWYKSSLYLENSDLKKTFGEIALKVIKNGCYYGYKRSQKKASFIQELPVDYCRSRYELNGKAVVEFNIKYFNDTFSDIDYRLRILKMFPKEFHKAYLDYLNGKLPRDYQSDDAGWFVLDPENTVKFNLSNTDAPLFASIIPSLMDLEEAQELDKKKMLQQILRIIVQKMPIDKNGDLIFDVEEAQALHSNAVAMLSDAIGVDVLTTFADVSVADMSDKGNVSSVDQLEKVERTVYNNAGVSQMQFNTSGNLALEKSIANDEGTLSDLLLQFQEYLNDLLKPFNKSPQRLFYKVQMLPTTIYNYKDLAKLYKEQTTIGFSKLLPQIALGHSQLTLISMAYFENELMNLNDLFIPPQMSSTMSSANNNSSNGSETKGEASAGSEGGRPELPDEEKSTKTIQNRESQS
jgi:hypothetical protein